MIVVMAITPDDASTMEDIKKILAKGKRVQILNIVPPTKEPFSVDMSTYRQLKQGRDCPCD
jgi:hypothetical protein